jgi:hypothetical protein
LKAVIDQTGSAHDIACVVGEFAFQGTSVPRKNKTAEATLAQHFRGKREEMRPLFEYLIAELKSRCQFELKVGKAYIGLKHKLVFAAIHVQTRKLVVELVARKKFDNPRIKKVIQFAPARWAHFVDVAKEEEINEQLLGWIGQSYE